MKRFLKWLFQTPGGWFTIVAVLVVLTTKAENGAGLFIGGAVLGVVCYSLAVQDRIVPKGYSVDQREDGSPRVYRKFKVSGDDK